MLFRSALICPLMDARRNQVYTGIYQFCDGELTVLEDQMAVGIDQIIQMLNERNQSVIFLGDGVSVYREIIEEKMMVPFSFAPAHQNNQRAGAVGVRAMSYYKQGKTESADDFVPEYLRLSQAERERMKRENG